MCLHHVQHQRGLFPYTWERVSHAGSHYIVTLRVFLHVTLRVFLHVTLRVFLHVTLRVFWQGTLCFDIQYNHVCLSGTDTRYKKRTNALSWKFSQELLFWTL